MENVCHDDEAIWSRRLAKRLAGVSFVKATADYAACYPRPPAPDPSDRTVSKRGWERSMQDFRCRIRSALRDQASQSPLDWLGGPEREETPAPANPMNFKGVEVAATSVHFLGGCGQDQRGSFCELPAERVRETMRSPEQRLYTRDFLLLMRNAENLRGPV